MFGVRNAHLGCAESKLTFGLSSGRWTTPFSQEKPASDFTALFRVTPTVGAVLSAGLCMCMQRGEKGNNTEDTAPMGCSVLSEA